ALGDCLEEAGPLLPRRLRPGRERVLGRGGSRFCVLDAGLGRLADDLFGGRIDDAVGARRALHPAAADVQAVRLRAEGLPHAAHPRAQRGVTLLDAGNSSTRHLRSPTRGSRPSVQFVWCAFTTFLVIGEPARFSGAESGVARWRAANIL